jgi:hypothetical protein
MTTTTFKPTAEQQLALDAFTSGQSLVIEAGAGTGKTATLKLLAESTGRRGQYVAFNKAIVVEAGEKMPSTVTCSTAHSLAYRAVGHRYGGRLRSSARMKSNELARLLRVDPVVVRVGDITKALPAAFLAGLVLRGVTNFCQSADAEPTRRHLPYLDGIDLPTDDGARTYANNDLVRDALVEPLRRAWADLSDVNGSLPFKHDHYLKLWQLSDPRIAADYIMLDEAQDANPVIAAVIAAQSHAQLVYVGDSQQQIYEFTGAVNALAKMQSDHRTFLTQSFRFGPAIADVANSVLRQIDGAELRLTGTDTILSSVGPLAEPDAVLCRTNAAAVTTVLHEQARNRKPHLVGGGTEVVSFARAAADLQNGRSTFHPELACFDSWTEVQTYVETDQLGGELRLLVKLVDDFGTDTILEALDRMPTERNADVIVSTAHKSKGREWNTVQLCGDFNPPQPKPGEPERELDAAELRLLYVAVTRARRELDLDAVQTLVTGRINPTDIEPNPLALI